MYLAQIPTTSDLLPKRGPSVYSSGLGDANNAIARYALKSSKHPNLIIASAIYDNDGNAIMPGYYELILSDDRQMLILAQSQNIIAKIPVFKIQEDKSQEAEAQPMDNKSQKKFDKEQKKKDKQNKKLIRQGKIQDSEPQIYTNASIQYEENGGYYLIKYERGKIRAWGAIKD